MTKGFALVTPRDYRIQFGASLLECIRRAELMQQEQIPTRVAHCRWVSAGNRKVIFSELGEFVT